MEDCIELFWQDVERISVTNDGYTAITLLNGCNVIVSGNGYIVTDEICIYIHNC